GNIGVADFGAIFYFAGKRAQPGSQHASHRRSELGFAQQEIACFEDVAHNNIPAIAADMKFASVPASTARRPNRARSERRFGASAPMPPIWMPMELKLANPHKA